METIKQMLKERRKDRIIWKSFDAKIKALEQKKQEHFNQMIKKETAFFSLQVGNYFMTPSNRIFHILDFEESNIYCNGCPSYSVEYADAPYEKKREQDISCYNVFSWEFNIKQINEKEWDRLFSLNE